MSAFEVALTPPRIKNARKASVSREPTDVMLGLFSAKAIVVFEDIPVTKTARRTLHMHNPTDDILKVLVTKTINPVANATLEWTSHEIPARGYVSMEIVWNPLTVWSTRETLQFTDNRNFKKDVAVILKSVDKTQTKKLIKKSSGINSQSTVQRIVTKKLTLKSPSPKSKQRNQLSTTSTCVVNGPKKKPCMSNRNSSKAFFDEAMQSKKVFGTYNPVQSQPSSSFFDHISKVSYKIEKENVKPSTPKNASSLFESFRFTPVIQANMNSSNVEYLASLPTPNSNMKLHYPRRFPNEGSPSHHCSLLNAADVIGSTPKPGLNNQTTNLYNLQTPTERTETDNAPLLEHIVNCTQFASQQTPVTTGQYNISFQLTGTSTVTKSPLNTPVHPTELSIQGRKLILDSLSVSPRMQTISENTELTNTTHIVNRTQIISSPVPFSHLSIIEEEYSKVGMSETYVTEAEHQRTYNIVQTPDDNLARDVSLVGTPLRKKFQSMKELGNSNSNLSLEQQILKSNQGSMPNLNNFETVKSFENNRYFYQSIEKDLQQVENIAADDIESENLGNTSICSIKSTVSTQSVAFQEHEILAQSSRFNLNEIDKSKPRNNKQQFYIPVETSAKGTNATNRNDKSNSRLSVSSPSINCIKVTPKLSQSTHNIKSTTASNCNAQRSSVITYANSKSSIGPTSSSCKKRNREENVDFSKKSFSKLSPPKRVCMDSESPKLTKGQAFRTKTWGGTLPKKFLVPSVPPQRLLLKRREDERVILFDPELHMRGIINPDPFAATTTVDPFLAATMYLDDRAVGKHEIQFKKWLNALVTIPGEIAENTNQPIDVGKLFNEVRTKDCTLAPTKETVSSNYLTKYRLNNLRAAAINLYNSVEMRESMGKLCVLIERKGIQIRQDRNLHLDVVLQHTILELLLSFNPLWLRLGMEVVFGELIPMHNNHDIVSLSAFILNRLFRDRYLEAKHPKVYAQGEVYAEHIKRHTLKKFLCLLYFLDVAKNKKIIKHNPCLFLKNSKYKETKNILLQFSSSLLGNIGDIQRELRRIGIVLTHKQAYIDEFDYAFRNLAIDLRDGVRLTKVMEIILLRDDLTSQLRVPAISRTQRVHNVGVALDALQNADFNLTGNITAADIADGHREKTLSLLWQIIYRFRAPKFNSAASVIQNWWREKWLSVCIRRRIRAKIEMVRHNAACVLQAAYRGYRDRKYAKIFFEQRTNAAITIQRYARRYIAINHFNWKLTCIVFIQRWYRNQKLAQYERQQYQFMRDHCCTIQKWYRRVLVARQIERLVPIVRQLQIESKKTYKSSVVIQRRFRSYLLTKKIRSDFKLLRQAAVKIQQRLRATLLMRQQKLIYTKTIQAVIFIQRVFRAHTAMQIERKSFLERRLAIVRIQRWFRACQLRNQQQQEYLRLKSSTVALQRRFRALTMMRKERENFTNIRKATLIFQRQFRAQQAMKQQRSSYLKVLESAIIIQQRYRARVAMKSMRSKFLTMKMAAVTIQRRYLAKRLGNSTKIEYQQQKRAAICIQRRFRAKIAMIEQRTKFLDLRHKVVSIQRAFRATLLMKHVRSEYQLLLKNVFVVQRRFRANKIRNICQMEYWKIQKSVRIIQQRFRAQIEMRKHRDEFRRLLSTVIALQRFIRAKNLARKIKNEFTEYRSKVIFVQQRFRAIIAMRLQRTNYKQMRSAALVTQSRVRAHFAMKGIRSDYLALRSAAMVCQKQFRAQKAMQQQRNDFLVIRKSAIVIQRHFKANLLMKEQRIAFLTLTQHCITIQRRYRTKLAMQKDKSQFELLKRHTLNMQRRFKANRLAKQARCYYVQLKKSTISVQRQFRANRLSKNAAQNYKQLKYATVCIQKRFRAQQLMRHQIAQFEQLKQAAIIIQNRFRAVRQTKLEVKRFEAIRTAVICIQRQFRAYILMRTQRAEYLRLKMASICIQRHLRAILLMQKQRSIYLQQKSSVSYIQRRFRELIEMRHQRVRYLRVRRSIITIQKFVRGYQTMKREREQFLRIRTAAITIQRKFIAHKQMLHDRQRYLDTMRAASKIQTFFRSYLLMKQQHQQFITLRIGTVVLQQRFRAHLLMQREQAHFLRLKKATICVQRRYRAKLLMKQISNQYNLVKCLVLCIQRKFRAQILMRKERETYVRLRRATCQIQRKYRAIQIAKCERHNFIQLRSTTIALQSRIRGFLARKRLQMLMTPELIEKRQRNKAAKKIQSFWRGYRIRKTRTPLLRAICEKAKELQKNVCQQNIVRNRIQGIVRFLKDRFNVKDALAILKELESISRTIPHTLIHDSVFIASFCYGIMSQAIRSEVDKQLISLCCRVLLNLARYKPTQQNVFQIHHFETVAQILYRWCDKDCDIFNVLCTVLYVFIQIPTINQQMRDFMVTREAIFLLRETKKLVARKERMRAINPPPWMPTLTTREKRTLPMLETNFGVKSATKNYIFNCAVFGFDTILSKMNIIV